MNKLYIYSLTLLLMLFPSAALSDAVAAAADSVTIEISQTPSEIPPGDAVLINLKLSNNAAMVSGKCYKHDVYFMKQGDTNEYFAIVGTDVSQKGDHVKLSIIVNYHDSEIESFDFDISLIAVEYPVEKLTVAKKLVTPPKKANKRLAEERKLVKAAYAKTTPEPEFSEPFIMPLNTKFSSTFGRRRIYNGVPKAPHNGLDLRGNVGKPVKVSNTGTIVMARDLYFTGNTMIVSHGLGLHTAYFHLSNMNKKVGDKVKRGDIIGKVGMTGRVTGPHLHFGVKMNGLYVNPLSALDVFNDYYSRSR